MVALPQPINIIAAIVEGSHLSGDLVKGRLTMFSAKQAEAELEVPVPVLANLKINVFDGEGGEIQGAVYGKVLGSGSGTSTATLIRFTSVSPEIEVFFRSILGGPEPAPIESEPSRMVSATPPREAHGSKPATPAVSKAVDPATLNGSQSSPASAAQSDSNAAGAAAASPPPPASAPPVTPSDVDRPTPASQKQPSPNNGADNRAPNITMLMSSTKLAEPEKKRGWFKGRHRQ